MRIAESRWLQNQLPIGPPFEDDVPVLNSCTPKGVASPVVLQVSEARAVLYEMPAQITLVLVIGHESAWKPHRNSGIRLLRQSRALLGA